MASVSNKRDSKGLKCRKIGALTVCELAPERVQEWLQDALRYTKGHKIWIVKDKKIVKKR